MQIDAIITFAVWFLFFVSAGKASSPEQGFGFPPDNVLTLQPLRQTEVPGFTITSQVLVPTIQSLPNADYIKELLLNVSGMTESQPSDLIALLPSKYDPHQQFTRKEVSTTAEPIIAGSSQLPNLTPGTHQGFQPSAAHQLFSTATLASISMEQLNNIAHQGAPITIFLQRTLEDVTRDQLTEMYTFLTDQNKDFNIYRISSNVSDVPSLPPSLEQDLENRTLPEPDKKTLTGVSIDFNLSYVLADIFIIFLMYFIVCMLSYIFPFDKNIVFPGVRQIVKKFKLAKTGRVEISSV